MFLIKNQQVSPAPGAPNRAGQTAVQLTLFERRMLGRDAEDLVRSIDLWPPIDVIQVASARRIHTVKVGPLPTGMQGYLLPRARGYEVHLRAGDSPTRQRFTLLHEAAHTMLPEFDREHEYRCADTAEERKEQLANSLAAELLFPWRFFEGDLGFYGVTLSGIEAMAKRYQASLEATAIHAVERAGSSALLLVARRSVAADPRRQLSLIYARGASCWPLHLGGRQLVQELPFRRALAERRTRDRVRWATQGGEEVALSVEAGSYPLTIAGRRRERIIAIIRSTEPGEVDG